MNNILLLSYLTFLLIACKPGNADHHMDPRHNNQQEVFDSVKAAIYGADDYGMKTYVMAFLKKGPNRDLDVTEAAQLQQAHLKNIQRMAAEKKLILAGPFLGDGEIRGIYIFDVEDLQEAEELTRSDPAIQAGSLEMELRPWYGSAALLEAGDIHKTLERKSITE